MDASRTFAIDSDGYLSDWRQFADLTGPQDAEGAAVRIEVMQSDASWRLLGEVGSDGEVKLAASPLKRGSILRVSSGQSASICDVAGRGEDHITVVRVKEVNQIAAVGQEVAEFRSSLGSTPPSPIGKLCSSSGSWASGSLF